MRPYPTTILLLTLALLPTHAFADDSDPRVGGDLTRSFFGPGTGIIVGIVDSGITSAHPALAGNDSLGNPRLVAQANFVSYEPTNTGQDIIGHGTAVTGVIGSSDPTDLGYAPDVRYIDARALDNNNGFVNADQVANAFGFALQNHPDIINASLNYGSLGGDATSQLSMMVDYIEDTLRIPVVVSAGNNGNATNPTAQGPADSFNAFSVAATSRASNFSQTAPFSAFSTEPDGASRPMISAPGDHISTLDKSGAGFATWTGTSFAAPAVTGMLSTQIEYGRANNLSTDPLVLRATLLNSAEKIANRTGAAWSPTAASFNANNVYTILKPLDAGSGAGQIDGAQLIAQYTAGQHAAGTVPITGWDLATITGPTGAANYTLSENLTAGESLSATLTWDRHVSIAGNGQVNAGAGFFQTYTLSVLDLALYFNDTLIANSIDSLDNIQQINWPIATTGTYNLRVTRLNVAGAAPSEEYSLAWLTTVPEPASFLLLTLCIPLLLRRKKLS